MRKFTIVNVIISLLIISVLLYLIGFEEILHELESFNLFYLFLSIGALFAMDLIMAYRIMILLNQSGEKLSFINILKSHFVGMLLADFSPSRTGYFATAAVLTNYKIKSEKALLSIFGPQIFDFAFKLFAGTVAVLYILHVYIGFEDGLIFISGVVLISILISIMLLVLFSKKFVQLFSFSQKIPLLGKLYDTTVRMQKYSKVVLDKTPHIIALILLSWNFRALSWYFAAKTVGLNLDTEFPEFIAYYFLQPLITMLEFIPSPTIAGLGISETGSALIFSLLGIPPAKAVLFALVARFKSTLLHLPAVPEALKTVSDNLNIEKSDSDK